ncbi:MAG: bifunctional DNA primase/polymerase [Candidatus Bathyarchaeota archaeon]|nr:bifunctional DNA primase/polymerase [Candidatus Bathyarchaeota archaeon]
MNGDSELKAAAEAYHSLGYNVVTVRGKQPLEQWQKWTSQRQTQAEFEGLNFADADGFGVVCGTQNRDGLYLAVIDYDVKNLSAEALEKGKQVLKHLPTTATERTPSGGQHWIYYVHNKPRTISTFHNEAAVELLGENKLCIMAPSQGYQRLNDNTPTVLGDIETVFAEALAKAGVARSKPSAPPQHNFKPQTEPRPCITEALKQQLTGATGHLMRLAIASEFKRCGYTNAEIVDLFRNQADFNAEVCLAQVESADPSKASNCKTIFEYGFCLPDCKLKRKNKDDSEAKNLYVPKPTVVTSEFIAEMVWNRKDPPEYLVYNFESDTFTRQKEIDMGENDAKGRQIIYVPPFNDSVKKGLVIVPSDAKETTWKEVFEEIDAFAVSAYDPCGQEALVKLLVRIAVGSWFLDRFVANAMFDVAGAGKFAPILPIRGPSQSGKNRLAFVLRLLSYRPYFEMSTYRIPSLYRPLDLWQGTLVLDEADFANTNEKSELIHFLNCRATGTPLSRQNPKNPKITDTFSNFGLTIVTQRRPFDDNATESRAIPYYSETSDKKLPVIETDEMLKQGLELQNKLLYLRMKYYRQVTIDKDAWVNDLNDHRLVASLLPLLALSKHEPSLKETITRTAKEVEKAKIEEKANSMDGLIINFLWEKISEGLFENWRPNIFYVLESRDVEENDGKENERKTALTTKHISEAFKWSPQSIRKALASLGIAEKGLSNSVKVEGKTQRVVFFDPRRLERRLREFVVDYEPNKVTQVTGVTDSMCSADKNSLLAYAENSNTLHRKTVTSVTPVTEPSDYPRYPE